MSSLLLQLLKIKKEPTKESTILNRNEKSENDSIKIKEPSINPISTAVLDQQQSPTSRRSIKRGRVNKESRSSKKQRSNTSTATPATCGNIAMKEIKKRRRATRKNTVQIHKRAEITSVVKVDTHTKSITSSFGQFRQHLERLSTAIKQSIEDAEKRILSESNSNAASTLSENTQQKQDLTSVKEDIRAMLELISLQHVELEDRFEDLVKRYNYQTWMLANYTVPNVRSNVEIGAECTIRPGKSLISTVFRD
jgi:uncharacterized protein YoxC